MSQYQHKLGRHLPPICTIHAFPIICQPYLHHHIPDRLPRPERDGRHGREGRATGTVPAPVPLPLPLPQASATALRRLARVRAARASRGVRPNLRRRHGRRRRLGRRRRGLTRPRICEKAQDRELTARATAAAARDLRITRRARAMARLPTHRDVMTRGAVARNPQRASSNAPACRDGGAWPLGAALARGAESLPAGDGSISGRPLPLRMPDTRGMLGRSFSGILR